MAGSGTFDFSNLNVIFGVASITGYADGDAIEISEENSAFNVSAGVDGWVDRNKNNANWLTITLRLAQTNPANQVLTAIHTADRLSSTPLPFFLKDSSGDTLITAEEAWIDKFPTVSFGNESKTREWVIKTGSIYVLNLAGN